MHLIRKKTTLSIIIIIIIVIILKRGREIESCVLNSRQRIEFTLCLNGFGKLLLLAANACC